MVHGENEVQIATAAAKRRGDIPEFLKNCPQLEEGLEIYWDAFGVLTTTRMMGQGFIGPIPWTAVIQYCDRYELDFEQSERMIAYLRALDKVYQEHFHSRIKASWQKASPQAPSPTSKS
jgi:hypothetical protein